MSKEIINRFLPGAGIIRFAIQRVSDFSRIAKGKELNLTGRGMLRLYNEKLNAGHAVAFEDWIIYDPNNSKPEPAGIWYKKMSREGWAIARVCKLPKETQAAIAVAKVITAIAANSKRRIVVRTTTALGN